MNFDSRKVKKVKKTSTPYTTENSLFSLLVKSEFTFGVRFGPKSAKIVVPPLAGKFTFSLSLSGSSGPRRGIQGGWTQAGRLAKPMQRNTTQSERRRSADSAQTQRRRNATHPTAQRPRAALPAALREPLDATQRRRNADQVGKCSWLMLRGFTLTLTFTTTKGDDEGGKQ